MFGIVALLVFVIAVSLLAGWLFGRWQTRAMGRGFREPTQQSPREMAEVFNSFRKEGA